jgi:hypothetical protein
MGDTCKWNATVDDFLSTHSPSWLMDYCQILDQVPEGVNENRNSDPEEVPVGLAVSIISHQRQQVDGFRQKLIWFICLCYLESMGNTHTSYNSLLELPHCYQSIANHDSLLIIDLGASICITPPWFNFITYEARAGECLIH